MPFLSHMHKLTCLWGYCYISFLFLSILIHHIDLYIPKAWSTVGLQSCTVAGCAEVYPAPIPGLLIHKSKTHCLPSRSCWYVGRRKNMETMRSRGKCDPRWVKGSGAWAGGCALSSLSCLQNGRHDFPSLDLGSWHPRPEWASVQTKMLAQALPVQVGYLLVLPLKQLL